MLSDYHEYTVLVSGVHTGFQVVMGDKNRLDYRKRNLTDIDTRGKSMSLCPRAVNTV